MKTLVKFIALLCIGIALPLKSQAAAPVYNLQLTLASEDFGGNVKDTYQKLTGSVRTMLGITRNSAFNLNADIYTRAYNDFDQWSSDGLLLEAIYSYIPTAGYSKPTYLTGVRQEFETFDDSNRDFSRTSLFLAVLLRLDDSLSITPGIQYSEKRTDDENGKITAAFLNTDKRYNQKWLTYLNLKYESEKPTASGMSNHNWPSSAKRSDIYKYSQNFILSLGANYYIERHHSIDVSYQRQNYGISDNADVTEVISIDYFYKF